MPTSTQFQNNNFGLQRQDRDSVRPPPVVGAPPIADPRPLPTWQGATQALPQRPAIADPRPPPTWQGATQALPQGPGMAGPRPPPTWQGATQAPPQGPAIAGPRPPPPWQGATQAPSQGPAIADPRPPPPWQGATQAPPQGPPIADPRPPPTWQGAAQARPQGPPIADPRPPPTWQGATQALPQGPPIAGPRPPPTWQGTTQAPPQGPPIAGPRPPPTWQGTTQTPPQGLQHPVHRGPENISGLTSIPSAPWPYQSSTTHLPQPGSPPKQNLQSGPGIPRIDPNLTRYPSTTPHPPHPGSPTLQPPQSGTSRIDPNQIPRPLPGPSSVDFETRINGQANLPPSATVNFVVKDNGNCSPRLMRSTLNQIPCSGDLLVTSGMPLAVMVQPFALPHPLEEPIQVVDFGESGPVRCARCKAYVNHFMKFIDEGRRFTCNLCGFTNETPRDYQCNLGPDGRRRDADQRPELSRGAVEFVASKEYLVRPPMPPVYYFLIDVSSNSVQTGAVVASCNAIIRVLADLPEGSRTMVGIATFDSTIHFYTLNKNLQQAAMLVVPDVHDVYTPLQSDLIVSLSEVKEQLVQLLESIPSMFQNNRIPESALGAAIKGAFLAMKSTGGKLLVFQSVLPSIGVGSLTARESEGRVSGEKEYLKLLQPADKTLKTMAIELAEFQVCVDLFLMANHYVDIISLSMVPKTTGGQLYFYHQFNAGTDSAKLYNDLRWNVTRPQGLEAVMRVRCSQGLQVQEYYGNFCRRTPTDVDLPAIDSDKTIMVTFKHDDKFQDGAECCFQCVVLYTTLMGQRRLRVITLSLSCTAVLSSLFRGADLDAQFAYLVKNAAQQIPFVQLTQVRDQVTSQCVNILYAYRKFCATASSSGQLILPEALKLLPLYTLALTKGVGLRSETRSDGHVDERAYWVSRVSSLGTSLAIPLVYPRMFGIHNLPPKEALGDAILPAVVPLSSENLDHDGVFLLELGEDAYIYVGKQASSNLLHQLFGVNSVDEIVSEQFVLPVFDNEESKRLNELVNEIRRERCSYLRLRLVKRPGPLEFLFFSFLVEDKSSSGLSYVEFLVHVHRQIQSKMS